MNCNRFLEDSLHAKLLNGPLSAAGRSASEMFAVLNASLTGMNDIPEGTADSCAVLLTLRSPAA